MISFLQANIQHGIDASALLLKTIQRMNVQVALIQEPYTGNDGMIRGLGGFGGVIFTAKANEKPRTCILVSGLHATLMPEFLTRDLVAVRVAADLLSYSSDVVIASAYFPHSQGDNPPPEEVTRLVTHCKNQGLQLLLGCDANAHNELWGSSDTNVRGESLLEYLYETNLLVINRGSAPTFRNAIREEVLDLTIGTPIIANSVQDWRVSNEETLADHQHILFSVANLCKPALEGRRIPRKTNWVSYREHLQSELELLSDTILPNQANMPADIDEMTERLTECIIRAQEASCPITQKRTNHRTSWWNARVEHLRRETRRLWSKAKRTRDEAHITSYRESRSIYKRTLRHVKRQAWQSFCDEIATLPEATRLHKALSKERKLGNMPIMKNGTFAETDEESLKILLETHFPDCEIVAAGDCESDVSNAAPVGLCDVPVEMITREKLHHTLKKFSPFKSPGIDGVFPALLQHGIDLLEPYLMQLFHYCIQRSYVPRLWRKVKVVFIPKPGKSDYTSAKSFRPISLTSFLLKTLERLVDWYLREEIEKHSPLHSGQHAYRKGRSTETALHQLTSLIEKSLSQKEFALGAFLDIEGAFSYVSFEAISSALRRKSVTRPVAVWIEQLLTTRLVITTRGNSQQYAIVARGCPQGGIASPLLWSLVIDSLLQNLTDAGIYSQAYADDVAVVVRGGSKSTVFEIMQGALNIIEKWCGGKGLSVNPAKTQIVLFTNKRAQSDCAIPLTLCRERLETSESIKFLGITLDSKLTWKTHLQAIIKRGKAAFWTLRGCLGREWGLQPKVVRWLYVTVIRPMVTYGCLVWWQRCRLQEARKSLASFQRLACIATVGAIRSTPTAALEVLLGLPPLHLFLENAATTAAHRLVVHGMLLDQSGGHASILSSAREWCKELNMPQDRIPKALAFNNRIEELKIPAREDWLEGSELIQNLLEDGIVWYTDGSLADGLAGAGAYCETWQTSEIVPLGRMATVFQAEVLAIKIALDECLKRKVQDKKIVICSDSRAALQALVHPEINSQLVKDCKIVCQQVGITNKLILTWVPGHAGVAGNEEADRLAREASSVAPCTPEPVLALPFCIVRAALNNILQIQVQEHWRNQEGLTHSKACIQPSEKLTKELLTLNRSGARAAVALYTGHGPFRAHLMKMGVPTDDVRCRYCGQEQETGLHVLLHCPAIWRERVQHLATYDASTAELRPRSLQQFAAAIKL